MALLCLLVVIGLTGLVFVSGDQDNCIGEANLGAVLDVVYPPAVKQVQRGAPLNITISVMTPYQPYGIWKFEDSDFRIKTNSKNSYGISEDRDDGWIKASTESPGPDTYSFHLHVDSYVPLLKIKFYLLLKHPCNDISISGSIRHWKNIRGTDLPTVLAVPKPVVDMIAIDQVKMDYGLEAPVGMSISRWQAYFTGDRVGDKLRQRVGVTYYEPVSLSSEAVSGGRTHFFQDMLKDEGKLWITKRPGRLGDTQAMAIVFMYFLSSPGALLFVETYTQIKLQDFGEVPAIMVTPLQSYSNLVRPLLPERELYDTDGTRILPYIKVKDLNIPDAFACLAEGGASTPKIAIHRISENGKRVVDPLYAYRSYGLAYSAHAVPTLALGRKYDFSCSAVVGNSTNELPFRIVVTEAVRVTSPNTTDINVNEDTFKNGLRFTCRATGTPKPAFKFYELDMYKMGAPPNANGILMARWHEPLQESQRIAFENKENEASMIITPGTSPFSTDESYRIVCVGFNQFTVDATYMEFNVPWWV